MNIFINFNNGLGNHLFVKVPRPEDNKVTFSVLSQSATCYYRLPKYQSYHSKVARQSR